jgi:WD40 repeat protein
MVAETRGADQLIDGRPSSGASSCRSADLLDLQSAAWQRGDPIAVETLMRKFAHTSGEADTALDLIHHEVILRSQAGESPQPADYLSRFPHLACQIKQMFEVEGYLNKCALPDGNGLGAPSTLKDVDSDRGAPPSIASVPGYAIEGVLGRGGMGVVYRARHLGLKRPVALKMVAAGAREDPDVLARFSAEADAVAQLQHPNIVHIYDVGEAAGQPFLAFELVEGQSLASFTSGTHEPPIAAAQVVVKLARALAYAHDRGVIHRDLKPANVLMTADGEPKITDFGLAKRLFADCGRTGSGSVLGTPSYMAPEQASGKSRHVGAWCDVYGLGAILYELLTGRPPFKAETPLETLRQVTMVEVVPPRRLVPTVPRDIETVCLKCLEKEPARRYPSASDLADDLERFLAGEPVEARPIGRLAHAWRWCSRNPATATLGMTLAIALVIATASILRFRAERARALGHLSRAAIAEKARSESARAASEAIWQASFAQARLERQSSVPGRRVRALQAIATAAVIRPDPKLRDEAIAWLAMVDLEPQKQWGKLPPRGVYAALGRNGRAYAIAYDDGSITIHGVVDDEVVTRIPGTGKDPYTMKFGPDGRYFAAILRAPDDAATLRMWDLHEERIAVNVPKVDPGGVPFSADGTRIAVARTFGDDKAIVVYNVATGVEESRLNGKSASINFRFSPDGTKLGIVRKEAPHLQIVEIATGKIVATMPGSASVRRIGWHPDGRCVAATAADSNIYVWRPASSTPPLRTSYSQIQEQLRTLQGHTQPVIDVVFDSEGDRLASLGLDGCLRLWDAENGTSLVSVTGDLIHVPQYLRFTGKREHQILSLEGVELGNWELHDDRIAIVRYCDGSDEMDYSSDGQVLVTAGAGGRATSWDVESAREIVTSMPAVKRHTARFVADGEVWIGGDSGLHVWSFERDPADRFRARTRLMRETPLCSPVSHSDISRSRWIVAVNELEGVGRVFSLDCEGEVVVLKGRPRMRYVSFHPDGRWIATGTFVNDKGVCQVWDARTGGAVAEVGGPDSRPAFSPDGRLLAAGSGLEYRIYATGTWQLLHAVPVRFKQRGVQGALAFSPDSSILAITDGDSVLRLVDPSTAAMLATLESPTTAKIQTMRFTPDGRRLCVSRWDATIEFWDLAKLQKRLGEFGLDWTTSASD